MESQVHAPPSETTASWTDEKHIHFLNVMESSFVTAMLRNNGNRLLPRLDRYLPDTAESTLDLNPHRTTKKHAPSGSKLLMVMGIMHVFTRQVVPQVQLGNAREGSDADPGDDKEQQRN
ncbi:uncharacterized protein G2W53_026545 [Senna tora]|uniref:Uncharacterized protein n=1 Tax=Senna tora TaxID=362788 RepID=A0A834WF68_9FABA|nr:uncharacterized protein G2W53_026545 [Senna tora]